METEIVLEKADAAFSNGDYASALELWRPLAEAGEEGARYAVGQIHYLSLHRFQWIKAGSHWQSLTENDFERWDAEDGAEALRWFTPISEDGKENEFRAPETLDEILEQDVDLRMRGLVYSSAMSGLDRALIKAILAHDFVSAEALLDIGADACAKTINDFSALIWACSRAYGDESYQMIRLLVERGADVNARTIADTSPLSYASRSGHLDAVKLLIEHGAIINDGESGGSDALFGATIQDQFKIVLYLLQQGAAIDAKPFRGRSALMAASATGHFSVVYLLLSKGADVTIKDPQGKTALSLTMKKGHTDIVELLRSFHAPE
jgi:ankyrin repeat protein